MDPAGAPRESCAVDSKMRASRGMPAVLTVLAMMVDKETDPPTATYLAPCLTASYASTRPETLEARSAPTPEVTATTTAARATKEAATDGDGGTYGILKARITES